MNSLYDDFKATAEQRRLLSSRTFTLRPLNSTGHLSFIKILLNTWQPILVFVLSLLILTKSHSVPLCAVVLFTLLVFPVMELAVILVGVIAAAIWSRVKWTAVLYWTWWPFWKFAACITAACLGVSFADYLWQNVYSTSNAVSQMQVYSEVIAGNVTSIRLQDAGIIMFDQNSKVDREMTGCFMNGETACIAPVVAGDQNADARLYDLFMVGTGCCSCPGDFRCGDWNAMGENIGGIRIVDQEAVKTFTLAAEAFSATFSKVVKSPIFFEWSNNPQNALQERVTLANKYVFLALLGVPGLLLLFFVILNGVLELLVWFRYAGPQDLPLPSDGMVKKMGQKFLPEMYNYKADQENVQSKYIVF